MLRILIMEDDIVDQMAIERMLSKKFPSAIISCCLNVKETLHLLQTETFDWVLTDFNLPDGTVFDILPYSKKTKMICLSGATDQNKIQQLKKEGLYDFFIKDQHLNYLEKIANEFMKVTPSTVHIKYKSESSTFPILTHLKNNFGENRHSWIEILDLLIEKSIGIEFVLLKDSVSSKNNDQTKFVAHKLQSGFRAINQTDILSNLQQIENLASIENVNWELIKIRMKELDLLFSEIGKTLSHCKSHLQNLPQQ